MTSKERAALRSQANTLQALFQVGKGGILKVLRETCPDTPRDIAEKLALETNSEVVGVIGGVMILYRYNPKLHEKKKTVRK